MLERFDKNMDANRVIRAIQDKKGMTKAQAMKYLRDEIPKEPYYQDKVKKGIKKAFPDAFVVKIPQMQYSQRGIPDILVIIDGHYFGFEIKRPILGAPTRIQKKTMEEIIKAGGTAAVVSYPEQAIEVIKDFRRDKK